MYCQSCQTKLTPRDKRCPSCGRGVGTSRDLGAGSSAPADSKTNYPLPPAPSLEEDSRSQPRPRKSKAARAPAKQAKKPGGVRRKGGSRRKASGPAPVEDPEPQGFSLPLQGIVERLVREPSLLEEGLEIYTEDGEAKGVGYSTAVGEIDLLARDDAGGWVVIQLAEPGWGKEIVSDLLERIGWVHRHLGDSGSEVRGIVLVDSMPDDLGYAAAAVADPIEFKLYKLELTFESVAL
ncbi:MAG: hypothetical protein VX466_11865 [Myxococcota bacterium]|nr:hypothetical protein [Myxococcota bacterium]